MLKKLWTACYCFKFSPLYVYFFLSGCFQIFFFLFLIFSLLSMICLNMCMCMFHLLFILGILWTSWICRFFFTLLNFEKPIGYCFLKFSFCLILYSCSAFPVTWLTCLILYHSYWIFSFSLFLFVSLFNQIYPVFHTLKEFLITDIVVLFLDFN